MTDTRPCWHLHAHPLLLAQLDRLRAAAARDAAQNRATANARLLAGLHSLMFDHIPAQPCRPEYRYHGRFWSCARLAGGRFQLFFQVDSETNRILYGWIAEPGTLPLHENQAFVMHGHICAITQMGAMVLPAAARYALGLQAGGQLGFHFDAGRYVLNRLPTIAHDAVPAPVRKKQFFSVEKNQKTFAARGACAA